MYRNQKVVVVMPAYNAARTLRQTYDEVREQQIVDHIIVVDDRSHDETVAIARTLEGVQVHVHDQNRGYGGNQKTCYRLALEAGADIILLDNMDVTTMKRAVEMTAGRALLEASGGINEHNLVEVARTGVDYISIGALTHSSPALDLSLELVTDAGCRA